MAKIKRRRTHLKCKSLDTEDGKDHIGKDGTNPEDLGSRSTLDTEPQYDVSSPYVNHDLEDEVEY